MVGVKKGETLTLTQHAWQELREKGLTSQEGVVVGVNRDRDHLGREQTPVVGLRGMLPGDQIAYIIKPMLRRRRSPTTKGEQRGE